MNRKNTIIALGAGIIIGFLLKRQLDQQKQMTPEKALERAKEAFKRQGSISGSWIYMKPEEIEKNGLLYQAYRGGITRKAADQEKSKQYEFLIDANYGVIIDSYETTMTS